MGRVRRVHNVGLGRWRRSCSAAVHAATARKEPGMSRFSEELKVVPKAARIIAGLVYAGSIIAWTLIFTFSRDQGLQSTPEAGKIALVLLPGLVLAIYVLLIGYVNGDAKRRGM